MSVGMIGSGAIGSAVARLLAANGTEVVLSNSRGAASLTDLAVRLGPAVRAGSVAEAAEADVVFVSVPWSRVPVALGAVPRWDDKVLVDTTNPLEAPTFRKFDLQGRSSSAVVASHAPGAVVVKAFNHLSPAAYAQPDVGNGRRVLFVSGDSEPGKRAVLDLIKPTGFVGVDLGGLEEGGGLHEFPGGALAGRQLAELG